MGSRLSVSFVCQKNDNKNDRRMIIKTTGGSTTGLPPYTFENEAHHQFVEDEEKQASGRG